MAQAYRKLSSQISAQAELIERQILEAATPVVLELKQQRAAIRPAMARTLALIGEGEPAKKRRNKKPNGGSAGYWAKMTPEERSAEMTRRMQKSGRAKTAKKLHPRDKDHPKHAEWLANMTAAVRKKWKSYSPREQKRRMKATAQASVAAAAARRAAKVPTVAMMREIA